MAQLDMAPAAPPGDCSRYVGFSSLGRPAVGGPREGKDGLSLPIDLAAQPGRRWQALLATWRELFRDNFRVADQPPSDHPILAL